MQKLITALVAVLLGGALFYGLRELLRPKQHPPVEAHQPSNGVDDLTKQQEEALLRELSQQL